MSYVNELAAPVTLLQSAYVEIYTQEAVPPLGAYQ